MAWIGTFGGSDLGCLVAKRVLEICADPATLKNARIQSGYLVSGLQSFAARFPFLEAVRHKGLVDPGAGAAGGTRPVDRTGAS